MFYHSVCTILVSIRYIYLYLSNSSKILKQGQLALAICMIETDLKQKSASYQSLKNLISCVLLWKNYHIFS